MLLSRAELAGFGMAIAIVVVMGIIALAGPFHHINKTHAAAGPMLIDKMIDLSSSSDVPYQFSPRNFTIKVGQPVTFENVSSTDHTATARDNTFNSGNIGQNQKWVFTPTKAGKIAYYCAYHPYMTGVITVVR